MGDNRVLFDSMYANYLEHVNPKCTREQFGDILRKPLVDCQPKESWGLGLLRTTHKGMSFLQYLWNRIIGKNDSRL